MEARLAPQSGTWDELTKPRGMHQTTFDRLRWKRLLEMERRTMMLWRGLLRIAPGLANDPDIPESLSAATKSLGR